MSSIVRLLYSTSLLNIVGWSMGGGCRMGLKSLNVGFYALTARVK